MDSSLIPICHSLSDSYLNKLSQKERESLLKLVGHKDTNQILQNKENQTPVKNAHSQQKEYVERNIEQIEIVKKLKEELQKEIDENKALRENLAFIQEKYKNENQQLSSENADLKFLTQKITEDFETLVLENSELTRQISFTGKKANDNESKTQNMLKNLENVRELVKVFLSENNTRKIKDIKERNFWQSIASERLIQESEPPTDFPFPNKSKMNEKLISKAEFDRLNLELKKVQEELKKSQNMLLTVEEENSKLHQKLTELQKEKQEESSKSAQQQRGLVRRINYLIQEKEKTEQEAKERNAYVAKLELKLVQQELCIKGLRSRAQSVTKPQELDGSFGLKKPVANTGAKEQISYGKIHSKQQKSSNRSKNKIKAPISPHAYNTAAQAHNKPDGNVNMNLAEVFKTVNYAQPNLNQANQEEECLQNELFADDAALGNSQIEEMEGAQEMHTSLLDEILQHSTQPGSKTILRQMQMRINNLEENLANNRQELALSHSAKTGINYTFEDEPEIAKSDAPRRYIGSDCFDDLNTSYKTYQ